MSTAREAVDLAKSEADFQAQIVDLAELNGWWTWHDNDSRRNKAGFLDLFILRGAVLLCLEVKTEKGDISPKQQELVDKLKLVRIVQADIVRPRHWDQVVAVLTARAR